MWGRVVITGRKETSEWFNKKIYFYFQQKKKKRFSHELIMYKMKGCAVAAIKKTKEKKRKTLEKQIELKHKIKKKGGTESEVRYRPQR
jgi:hypothetical protein